VSSIDWPIAIFTATENISTGVCLWRQRQQLFATVAVKATFTLVPGAAMTGRAPLPIERTERSFAQGAGIEPGDIAPCLVQPEVWVRGHAWYPPAQGAPSVRVRLVVARDGNALVRKSVEIPIQQDPFVPPYLHALAPLARSWPVRTRLLGSFDWKNLDDSPIELPELFDWSYFQAAPMDQRLGPLRGDEWLRLEAIHSTVYKFDTQLPSASCAVMMFGQVDPFRQGVPLRVGLDTIQIDVDQGTCALVFRGHTPLPADVALEDLQFVAGLGFPDRPMPNLQPRLVPLPAVEDDASILVTSFIDADVIDASVLSGLFDPPPALPFRAGTSSLATPSPQHRASERTPETRDDAGQTFMLDQRLIDTLTQRDTLPFHERLSVSRTPAQNVSIPEKPVHFVDSAPAAIAPIAQIAQKNGMPLRREEKSVAGPEVDVLGVDVGSTFFLSAEMLEKLTGVSATPFVGGEPAPERDEPVGVLTGLPFQPVVVENDEVPAGRLGAIFLAAMEESMRTNGGVSWWNGWTNANQLRELRA